MCKRAIVIYFVGFMVSFHCLSSCYTILVDNLLPARESLELARAANRPYDIDRNLIKLDNYLEIYPSSESRFKDLAYFLVGTNQKEVDNLQASIGYNYSIFPINIRVARF